MKKRRSFKFRAQIQDGLEQRLVLSGAGEAMRTAALVAPLAQTAMAGPQIHARIVPEHSSARPANAQAPGQSGPSSGQTTVRPAAPGARLIPYSGHLGNVRNGGFVITFRIHNKETGALLFQETQTLSVNRNRFTAMLGAATPGGIPASILEDRESIVISHARVPKRVVRPGPTPSWARPSIKPLGRGPFRLLSSPTATPW